MRRYAQETSVPVDRSLAEIEKTLKRYGADQFLYATKLDKAMIMFRSNNMLIRFIVPMPDPGSNEIKKTKTGRTRKSTIVAEAYSKEIRRRWRALSLSIKAKLESVETGIALFEEEFMANIVLPNDQTVGEFMIPQIKEVYIQGKMPKMLPFLS